MLRVTVVVLVTTFVSVTLGAQSRVLPQGTFRLSVDGERNQFLAASSNGQQLVVAISSPKGSRIIKYSADLRVISSTETSSVARRIWLSAGGQLIVGEFIGSEFHVCRYSTDGRIRTDCIPAGDPSSEIWMSPDGMFSLGQVILSRTPATNGPLWRAYKGRTLTADGLIRSAVVGDSFVRVATRSARGAILDTRSGREQDVDFAQEAGYANQRLSLQPNQQLVSQLVPVANAQRILLVRAKWHPLEGLPLDVFDASGKHVGAIRLDTISVDPQIGSASTRPDQFVPTVILAAGNRVFGIDTRSCLGAWYETSLP